MAEDDIFIGEVNEDVRRDTATAFLKKYAYALIAIVLVVVALVAFMEWRSNQAVAAGEAQAAAIELAIEGDAGAKDALIALKTPSALSNMMLAKLELDAGNKDAALAIFRDVAGDSSNPSGLVELAKLRVFELDETVDGAALMNPNAAYEIEAKLIEAERRHANADIDGAVEIISGLLQNDRAQSMRSLLESTLLAWGVDVPDPTDIGETSNTEEPANAN